MSPPAPPPAVKTAPALLPPPAAPDRDRGPVAALSTRELYELARRRDVRGRSLMTRAELAAALADLPGAWG